MTLGTTHSIVSYNGDGTMERFDVTFEFHAASDLEVILVTVASGVEQVQTQGFDYEVTGGNGGTGQIHFRIVVPAATERVVIRRVSPDIQPDDLVDGGALAAEPLERRLDIIAARLQELETDITRSLKVVKGSQAPESGLTLNLTGGMGGSLQVASDELGVIIATGTVPDNVVTSAFGETWAGLADASAGRSNLGLTSAATTALGTSGASIPLLNGANTYSGASTFSGDVTFNSDVTIGAAFILGSETLTIDANGLLTPTKCNVLINTFNSAAADNLDSIAVANHPIGAIIELRAGTAGQVPTLRHAQGAGNIYLADDANVALDDRDKTLWLQHRSTGEHGAGWYEVGRSFSLALKQWSRLTALDTSSGTEAETTAIPATTDMIKLAFDGVSLSGTDDIQVEVGDATSYASTSNGNVGVFAGTSTNETVFLSGPLQVTFQMQNAAGFVDGIVELVKASNSNKWFASGGVGDGARKHVMAGRANLSGVMTRLRVTITGASSFDNGAVYVWVYS